MTATPTTMQKVAAEVLGTFVLVFIGCGTALVSDVDYVATGLSFGLAVMVMAYAVGGVSGGHFNPAVTLGAAVGGRLAWREVGVYVGAQLAGALAAGLALWIAMNGFPGFDSVAQGFAQNSFGDEGTGYAAWAAFFLEMLLTGVFVLVILAVTDTRNEHPAMGPLAIGLALAMIHFTSIGATGTSVNPARSIGVAVFAGSGAILQLWLFIAAPLLGAALAGLLYPLVFGNEDAAPDSEVRPERAAPDGVAEPRVPESGVPDHGQQHGQRQYGHPSHPQPQEFGPAPGAHWPDPDDGDGQTQVRPQAR